MKSTGNSHDCVRQQYAVSFVISVQKQWTRSIRAIARWRISVLIDSSVAETQDLTWSLCNTFCITLNPPISECALVVFNAFLAFTTRLFHVACILVGTCNSSLNTIVTTYGSIDFSVDRDYDRSHTLAYITILSAHAQNPSDTLPSVNLTLKGLKHQKNRNSTKIE